MSYEVAPLIAFSVYDFPRQHLIRELQEIENKLGDSRFSAARPPRPALPATHSAYQWMMCISALSEITPQNRVYLNWHCEPLVLLTLFYHKAQTVASDCSKARGASPGIHGLCFRRGGLSGWQVITPSWPNGDGTWPRDLAGRGEQHTVPKPNEVILTAHP